MATIINDGANIILHAPGATVDIASSDEVILLRNAARLAAQISDYDELRRCVRLAELQRQQDAALVVARLGVGAKAQS